MKSQLYYSGYGGVSAHPIIPNQHGVTHMAKRYFRSNYSEVNQEFYPPFDNAVCIPLTQGKFAIVDADDHEYLSQWKWGYSNRGYAVREQGKRKILMHRQINNTPIGVDTDHINRNRLDNRRCNLRSCTRAENSQNRKSRINSTSQYSGVSWNTRESKWVVSIKFGGNTIYIGSFLSEVDAAVAYDKKALLLYGKNAKLNFSLCNQIEKLTAKEQTNEPREIKELLRDRSLENRLLNRVAERFDDKLLGNAIALITVEIILQELEKIIDERGL